jgi:hypothetical protein
MTRVLVCLAALLLPTYGFTQSSGPSAVPGDADAGGARTLLALPDGRVFQWRRSSPPVQIEGLPLTRAVAVGGEHMLALSRELRVLAWGGNQAGQLGDGSRISRNRPVAVPALSDVVSIAAGREHSIALTVDGRLWVWGSNEFGQLGTPAVRGSTTPLLLSSLPAIASVAVGDFHTIARTRDGAVFAWGRNNRGQLGDETRVDRWSPVLLSLRDIEEIAAGSTHSLARDGDGAVFTWGSGGRGELGTGSVAPALRPVRIQGLRAAAIRGGRRFSAAIRHDGTLAMWGANDSGQLGDASLVDRAIPHDGPPLASISALTLGGRHAVAVTSTGEVWTWGGTTSTQQRIHGLPGWGPPIVPAIDLPPTIVATVSPAIAADWFVTPVTVTFECSDDSGQVTCPSSITLSLDGPSQVATGTAIDAAGHQSTASVSVNIDRTPPSLELDNVPEVTTIGEIRIRGRADDSVSGLAGPVLCNGTAALMVEQSFSCAAPLLPGANLVIVRTVDRAGHSSTASVVVTRVTQTPELTIVPDTRTMSINEVARLGLHDANAAAVPAATWSSSDSRIAVLTGDDPPFVRAVAPGTVTISAVKDGIGAEATVTVIDAAVLAPGSTRWSIAPTPGYTMRAPIFMHRVSPEVPEMILVESRQGASALLRGVTSDGNLMWSQQASGTPLMGDAFGGLITGIPYDGRSEFAFSAYTRVAIAGAKPGWRWNADGVVEAPAQSHDGTLYATERIPGLDAQGLQFVDTYLVALDGATGELIVRYQVPRDVHTFVAGLESEGVICSNIRTEAPRDVVGPIAGSDGRGYALIRRRQSHRRASCFEGTPWPERTIDDGVDLVILSSAGSIVIETLYSQRCTAARGQQVPCDIEPSLTQIAPDGLGGILAVWTSGASVSDGYGQQTHIARRNGDGGLSETAFAESVWISRVGQDGVFHAETSAGHTAFDVDAWTPRWSMDYGPAIVAAHPDGSALIHDGTQVSLFNADGQSAPIQDLSLSVSAPIVQAFGNWIGLNNGKVTVVAGDFPDATRFDVIGGGNAQRQRTVRRPGLGIFAKSHPAVLSALVFDHTSIRITPTVQDYWRSLRPMDFVNRDEFGNFFLTMGAGTGTGDTSASCAGTLTKGINRERDVTARPTNLEPLPVDFLTEMRLINDLFVAFDGYQNDLPYACFPEANPGHFNSNSFTSGLLRKVEAPLPAFPLRGVWVPGWPVPVPPDRFNPRGQ